MLRFLSIQNYKAFSSHRVFEKEFFSQIANIRKTFNDTEVHQTNGLTTSKKYLGRLYANMEKSVQYTICKKQRLPILEVFAFKI